MGLLSWWKPSPKPATETKKPDTKSVSPPEIPGMHGAVQVRRPQPTPDVTVFEFGSVAASADKVTLAGYCPVSDDLEPCQWDILPATGSDAPLFRIDPSLRDGASIATIRYGASIATNVIGIDVDAARTRLILL